MKKLKFSKIILSLFLISSTVLSLFSCNSSVSSNTEKNTENDVGKHTETLTYRDYDKIKDYEIIAVNDGYRLVFNDPAVYEAAGEAAYIGTVNFDSLQEFHDDLINGALTDFEKHMLFSVFPKDEQGIIIPDPNNLYYPVLPKEDCQKKSEYIIWSNNGYRWEIDIPSDEDAYGYFYFLTKELYIQKLEKEKDLENLSLKWGNASTKTVDEKEIITFPKGNIDQVRYTVSNENKSMYVIETRTHYDDTIYDTVVFYISNGAYFQIIIEDMIKPFDPEWLLEFDAQRYVPENT